MTFDNVLHSPFVFFSNEDVLEDDFFSLGRDYSSSWDDEDEDEDDEDLDFDDDDFEI
ncbi:MAG: hypothetical protein WEB94_01090 [Candidatus Paceibacterota bacterium]